LRMMSFDWKFHSWSELPLDSKEKAWWVMHGA